MRFKITDKVRPVNPEKYPDLDKGNEIIVIGLHGDNCAVSDGLTSLWLPSNELRLKDITEAETYRFFEERLLRLRSQYASFKELAECSSKDLSTAYQSFAANTLSTIDIVDRLKNVYVNEYK